MKYLLIILFFFSCTTSRKALNKSFHNIFHSEAVQSDSAREISLVSVEVKRDSSRSIAQEDSIYERVIEEEVVEIITPSTGPVITGNLPDEYLPPGTKIRREKRTTKESGKKTTETKVNTGSNDSTAVAFSDSSGAKESKKIDSTGITKIESKKTSRWGMPWYVWPFIILLIAGVLYRYWWQIRYRLFGHKRKV